MIIIADEAFHIIFGKRLQMFRCAKYVVAHGIVGKKKLFEFIKDQLGRSIFIGIDLIDDHLFLFLQLFSGKNRVKDNVVNQLNGAPLIINGAKQYITDKEEMYSGCYGNVAVSLYPYEFTGKYGVGVGLNAIQKTKDGERLDGGASIDDFDFEEGEDLSIFG